MFVSVTETNTETNDAENQPCRRVGPPFLVAIGPKHVSIICIILILLAAAIVDAKRLVKLRDVTIIILPVVAIQEVDLFHSPVAVLTAKMSVQLHDV